MKPDYIKANEFAFEIYKNFKSTLIYHNINHALDVRDKVRVLADREGVTFKEKSFLELGALFHDIGFIDTYTGHEKQGVLIVKKAFPVFGFDENSISFICSLILSTCLPQNPQNHLEKILCDADLDNLGRNDFFENLDSLFEEKQSFEIKTSKQEWYEQTLKMMTAHEYFTDSQKNIRNKKKQENLKILKDRIQKEFVQI